MVVGQQRFDFNPQIGHSLGQFRRPGRCFTEPKRNSRRLPFCVFDTDDPGIDAQDSPRRVAKLKDVASETLDREVLIHGADESLRRFDNYSVIGVVRNRAAGSQGDQSRAAPAAQTMVYGVMMNQRRTPAAFRAETFGQHFNNLVELVAGQISIWPG